MTYDPTTPVDLVFGKIDDLLMYGEFANCPYTATQAITKGHHILNNCGTVYNDYICSWNRIQENQKTWNRFKMHFRLEATNALSIGDLGFGSANFMNEVVDRLSTELLHRANLTSDNVPVQSNPVANSTDQNLIQEILEQNHDSPPSRNREVVWWTLSCSKHSRQSSREDWAD